jgi:hypothetical protein
MDPIISRKSYVIICKTIQKAVLWNLKLLVPVFFLFSVLIFSKVYAVVVYSLYCVYGRLYHYVKRRFGSRQCTLYITEHYFIHCLLFEVEIYFIYSTFRDLTLLSSGCHKRDTFFIHFFIISNNGSCNVESYMNLVLCSVRIMTDLYLEMGKSSSRNVVWLKYAVCRYRCLR